METFLSFFFFPYNFEAASQEKEWEHFAESNKAGERLRKNKKSSRVDRRENSKK